MNRNVFKVILFGLLLNIATGIMMVAIVDVNGNPIFSSQDMGRVSPYDPTSLNMVEDVNSEKISPGGIAEDKVTRYLEY